MNFLHGLEIGVLIGAVGLVAIKYVAKKGWAAVVAKVKADLATV